ncbi:hypothetical protein GYMLUDRAFT_165389 [Collybiopsis luxurians FD-317 M1]|uniref:Phosphoglycerate mutase-like protein n=1 Tax=Collybiopsis luxurians FD-317 M1 TaxID=944289 RepID=A0A0D0CRK7_9AGAR|nr:hypothetical protein GYMLUDRAFT_165389 [Collybiopsis luxurians FD-317 M1]
MLAGKVYLVRHGETNENRAHIIQGQRDTLLNDEGRNQAGMVKEVFRNVDLDWALTSDLKRAAEIKLVKERKLRERGLGKLEGMHLSERRKQSGVDETAESPEAFLVRAFAWWDTEIIQGISKATKYTPLEILVVSHGGFISSLVRNLIASGRVTVEREVTDWVCYNVSVTTIEVEEGGKAKLARYSDTTHVKVEELVQYNADVLRAAGL